MTVAQLSFLFASLALACFAAVAVLWVLQLVQWRRPAAGLASEIIDGVRPLALWLGGLVATVTMLGSLYYSLVQDYLPCELCWYQRICVYPLSVILLIAAARRDTQIWKYVVPVASVGVVIAAYHSQLQAFPEQQTFCLAANPCTTRYVWEFGFVSLPLMDLAALLFIITMVLIARTKQQPTQEQDDQDDQDILQDIHHEEHV